MKLDADIRNIVVIGASAGGVQALTIPESSSWPSCRAPGSSSYTRLCTQRATRGSFSRDTDAGCACR